MQEYNNVDQKIHMLCQVVAKVNRTFTPKKDDDSHTNLFFDNINNKELDQWIYHRGLANNACLSFLGMLQQQGEIRIWPHHFDTGVYVVPNQNIGIGFGLAMKDDMIGSPYYYISGYPLNGEIPYENLPLFEKGKWKIEGDWKGAALPLDEIFNSNNIEKFIQNFIGIGLKFFLGIKIEKN